MASGHYKGQQKNGNNTRLRKVLFPDIAVLTFHCLCYLEASDKTCKLLYLYWLSGQDAALAFVIFINTGLGWLKSLGFRCTRASAHFL